MYFHKENGKQHLDLTGNLIISHNSDLVKARAPSSAPAMVKHAKYILLTGLNPIWKIKATFAAISFIWGKNQSLKVENTNFKKSFRKSRRADAANEHPQ